MCFQIAAQRLSVRTSVRGVGTVVASNTNCILHTVLVSNEVNKKIVVGANDPDADIAMSL